MRGIVKGLLVVTLGLAVLYTVTAIEMESWFSAWVGFAISGLLIVGLLERD